MESNQPQCTDTVYMVRPSHFGYNPETAMTNAFQSEVQGLDIESVQREFDLVQERLAVKKVRVITASQADTSASKDALFPNNWFTTHTDGRVVIYPMCAASRRDEVDNRLKDLLTQCGYLCREITDFRDIAGNDQFLEGTGSVVFDHSGSSAYMTSGPRSDLNLFGELCKILEYDAIPFRNMVSPSVYHTNVMMTIGERFCIICDTVIEPTTDLTRVIKSLESSGREMVKISKSQMGSFCANTLELRTPYGPILAISETSVRALNREQLKVLEKYTDLCVVDIPLIEKAGGGSIRCMLAEIFLPKVLMSKEKFSVVVPEGKMMKDYFRVRWECLRKPWGQAEGSEIGDDEDSSKHFCVVSVSDGTVTACGRSHQIAGDTVQFRYMAVTESYRGKGLGKLLVSAMEEDARKKGYSKVMLHARENAVRFYESNGYTIKEESYILFDTIQHYKMVKELS